jgi:UDP-N-acetylglucosamine 4-epimerase
MKVLVPGGFGFIGSNIVCALLDRDDVDVVRVLDNLSTGFRKNLNVHSKLEVIIGDIRDFKTCMTACKGMTAVLCQAALGSVPRSMKTPIVSHDNNVNGFANVLEASRQCGIKRVIYASSSAVYGNEKTIEDLQHRNPISFYGLTKFVNELYSEYYTKYFGMEIIGLRYHNVFGKNQSLQGEYSAVIPLFVSKSLKGEDVLIHGSGNQSRDFTHVSNVVNVNMLCLFTSNVKTFGRAYDVGLGKVTSVNDIFRHIKDITKSSSKCIHVERRAGDIDYSCADLTNVVNDLNYELGINVYDGLVDTVKCYM